VVIGVFHIRHVTELVVLSVKNTTMIRQQKIFNYELILLKQIIFMECTNLDVELTSLEVLLAQEVVLINAQCLQVMELLLAIEVLWQ